MSNNEYQIGIFLTDASFDKKTGVSVISMINLETEARDEYQGTFSSPQEAETKGIVEVLTNNVGVYKNILIYCDNKFSVRDVQDKVNNSNYWNGKYNMIQLVWLPRKYTSIADHFSKHIKDKGENMNLKENSFKNKIESKTVMDLYVSKEQKINILREIIVKKVSIIDFANIELNNEHFMALLLNQDMPERRFDLKSLSKDINNILKKEPKYGNTLATISAGLNDIYN
jgi:ribosomal protein S15P/S13E